MKCQPIKYKQKQENKNLDPRVTWSKHNKHLKHTGHVGHFAMTNTRTRDVKKHREGNQK